MARFDIDWTPGKLVLEWTQEGDDQLITLTGDVRTKELKRTRDLNEARAFWAATKKHYLDEKPLHDAAREAQG